MYNDAAEPICLDSISHVGTEEAEQLLLTLLDAPTNNEVLRSAKFILRDSSTCHEILQYILSSLVTSTTPSSREKLVPFKHLLYVFTEIFRLATNGDLAKSEFDTYSTHFRTHFPWISQFIYTRSGIDDREEIVIIIDSWKDFGYISSLEHDVIMHADVYNFNHFKTVDIESVGAGTLCATLSAHMRISLGDYKETIFRNIDDVSAAYRRIESRPNTDVEDFIRNFT